LQTIKITYKISEEDKNFLEDLRRQYSNVVRYSFNRFKEDIKQKDIRKLCSNLKSISGLNSWIIQCAIKEAESIYLKCKKINNFKVIFGSNHQFNRRLKGLISNNVFKQHRLLPICIQGESSKQGNRSFKLDIINNNQIILKVSRNKHIIIDLPTLHSNYKTLLYKLEQLNNISYKCKGHTYQIKIDSKYIYISFDNLNKKVYNGLNNRYIGIDLNPNEIGISIKEDDKILELKHFLLNIDKNKPSKIEYELYDIAKKIEKLFTKWNCKYIMVEDLNIKSTNHKKGKTFNRVVNNRWLRNKFINNLEKRIKVYNCKLYKINAAYTSTIGNVMYNYSDPINSSLEIGRRGYEIIIKKKKDRFYPDFKVNLLKDQWKEYFNYSLNTWINFHQFIKNSKLKYRVPLNQKFKVLSQLSKKSKINYFIYPI
jgi:predicted transposase